MGKKNEAARMLANLNGPWSNAACMGYCLIAMRRANLRPGAQRRVLMVLEQCTMSAWKTPKKQAMPIRRDKDMERFVIVMPVDTSAYLLPCDDGDTCKLETLQKLVGGPIEMADTCLAASWAREDVDSIQMAVNEEGLLQELPYNEHATDLYAFNYMSSIVGPAVLMAARGDELIGFAKSVAESICAEWEVPLEAPGEGERFQTFNPD